VHVVKSKNLYEEEGGEKMKLKTFLVAALLLVAMAALAACGGGATNEPTATTPPAPATGGEAATAPADTPAAPAAPAEGVRRVTHVHMSESPHMDPIRQNDSATADINLQMYEGLVQFTPYPYNEIVPLLATSWTQINPTTWEFNLRQGVQFHDGADFNADVWRWSIERLIDPREAAPALFVLEMIEDVITVDTYTVHVVTEFPFVPLLGHLTHQTGYAVSPIAMFNEVHYRINSEGAGYELSPWQEEVIAFGEAAGITPDPIMVTHRPVGTGPFMYGGRASGDHTLLLANDNHWRARPQIDELVFLVIPDPITRFAMVQTGDGNSMELAMGDVVQLPLHPQVMHHVIAGTGIDYIGFNFERGPLADQRVRRALTHGLNAQSVIDGAYEGIGIPAVGPIGPNVLHSPHDALIGTRPEFNPELARELLAEAGFVDNLELNFWTNHGNAGRLATAEIAQHYWSQIGVTINVETIEWGVYLDMTAAGEHDLFMLGWTTITGDPDYGTFSLFHSDFHGDPGNRTFYSNPRVDEILVQGRMETDSTARAALYHELTELLIEDAPWIWLRHPIQQWGTNGLNGFALDFNNRPHFANVTLQ